jgi:DNA-binding Lrp family transcriptional regulator
MLVAQLHQGRSAGRNVPRQLRKPVPAGTLRIDKRVEPKINLRCCHASFLLDNRTRSATCKPRLATGQGFCSIADNYRDGRQEACMVPFFVQIKCHLGKSYDVANRIADAEIASEIYSTAGEFDLLVKFYVDDGTDIGHFINEKVQTIPGIQDTRTILTFKAFGK